jgi:HEAT repeat protein
MAANNLTEATEFAQTLTAIGPDAVPALVRALKHPVPFIRPLAATSLGTMGLDGVAGAPALVQLLTHPDPALRAAATYALARQQTAVVKRLVEEAGNPDGSTRLAAITSLMAVQQALQPLQPALIKLTRDPDPEVRRQALERLQQLRQPAPPVPVFLSSLADPDASVRLAAVSALGSVANLPPAGVDRLGQMLKDPDPKVSEAVTRLMESRAPTNSAHTTSTTGASPAN